MISGKFFQKILSTGTRGGLLSLGLMGGLLSAQNTSTGNSLVIGDSLELLVYVAAAVLVVIVLMMIMIMMNMYAAIEQMSLERHPELQEQRKKAARRSFLDKLNASVDIEHEVDVTLDHEYDGIRELDNNLPPWWKYGFYVTIIWAAFYLYAYHWAHIWPGSEEEYNMEMEEANTQVSAFLKTSTTQIDENNVTVLTDAALLEKGKTNFLSVCGSCHGNAGEGGIGPNLTDDYWLHGGSISDIFKTIKYGVTDKGMPTWEKQYSGQEIAEMSSFIKSLKGTNPPNAKEKQGDLFKE